MNNLLFAFSLCHAFFFVQLETLPYFMTPKDLEELLGDKRLEDVQEYEVMTPFQIDGKGEYLTHDLTTAHTRARRDEYYQLRDTPARFEFTAFGERRQMTVKPNNGLLAPGFFMQIFGENSTVQADFDVTPCHFVGEITSHQVASHVAISTCQGLMGVVVTDNSTMFVQPLPHHLVRSDRNVNNHTHVVYKRAMQQAAAERIECAVEGYTSTMQYDEARRGGEEISETIRKRMGRQTKSSVSHVGGRYIIESLVVGDSDFYRKHGSSTEEVKRYILTVMNMASSLYNTRNLGLNVRLVLTRIQLFTSLAAQKREGLRTNRNRNSRRLLATFCKWQAAKKPQRDDDPLYYDHAFLFIGRGMCYGKNEDCWELGRAWIEGMCSDDDACSVISDKGLQIGFVVAHELGHNIGMLHDGARNQCRSEDGYLMKSTTAEAQRIFLFSPCSKRYLLNYLLTGDTHCLKDSPTAWETGFGRNYYNYPGNVYTRDQQCKLQFGKNATYCYKEPNLANSEICKRLWCDDKSYDVCVSSYTGAADGTPCDAPYWRGDRICYRRRCLWKSLLIKPQLPAYKDFSQPENPITIDPYNFYPISGTPTATTKGTPPRTTETPTPGACIPNPTRRVIDGQWNLWSAFTPCGRSCGGAFRYRDRQCAAPRPRNCGRECQGSSRDIEFCNPAPCRGVNDYRQIQCSEHNTDMPGIRLVPVYNVPREKECRLKCVSVSNVTYIYRRAEAAEGTRCNNRTNDRCYFGKCHPVGCDNTYGSSKQFDRCGVCGGNGDGRQCRTYSSSYHLQQEWSGHYDVAEFPAKASRISITEKSPSPFISLALRYVDGSVVLNGGHTTAPISQTIYAAGTLFVYNRLATGVESIEAEGPVDRPLIVKMLYNHTNMDIPRIVYSYDVPSSVPDMDNKYRWLAKRSNCSAECGKGRVITDLRCAHQITGSEVDISKCSGLLTPRRQSEECYAGMCIRYFWKTDKWSNCSRTCGSGTQTRKIVCQDIANGKNFADSYCQNVARPDTIRSCAVFSCPTEGPPSTSVPTLVYNTVDIGDWTVSDWSNCSKTCGKGEQNRTVFCKSNQCPDRKPQSTRSCNLGTCCTRDKNLKVCSLLLSSKCLDGCSNGVIKKFCCKICSQQARNKETLYVV